uniref:VWFA domain-containing protein n=1 Tax=Panagrolaimus davidi TaxID=227884 RepID=A0A914Q2M2_9BILA
MIDPTLEYKSPSNLAIVAAFTRYSTINFSFSYWFVDPPIPTEPPTTTIDPRPFTPLNCSGAMDLVFVIDASDTMTAERLEIIKSQLIIAIDQNGIKWDRYDYDNARIGIVLSTGFTPGEPTSPYRYNDLKGCPTGYNTLYCPPTVISTDDLKKAINDIPFYGGNNNDIALSMNISLTGDYEGFPPSYQIFGDQIFNGYGDRSSVPNAMIVISGADSSQVSHASNLLKLAGIQVFSIGFEDLPISQLHAIAGNPARAFSTQPGNLANTIRKICTGDFDNFSTITSTPSTSISTVDPRPFIPLNCSGEMDLVIVIDTSDTMTFERLEVVKSQLIIAINQNRITTDYFREEEMAIAHVGIVLSTAFSPGKPTNPYKYYDIKGCPIYYTHCDPTTNLLKEYIENIDSMGGINNGIASSMNSSLKGDFQLTPNTGYTFGGPLFGGPGDRPNVPNAMFVISGPDTSNVGPISNELKLAGVQVFSIGFQDLPISQLQAISGSPSRSFSTYPENLANTIGKICSGDFGSTSTINSPTSTTTATTSATTTTTKPTSSIPTSVTPTTAKTSTTTVDPRPFIPLNCSGEMDLVIVIDASDTMTFKRLEVVKSQLIIAINQNRIRTDYYLQEEGG